ncbi:Transglutaminase-like enzyme, putative cysteine protease [Raineyella antarctica]|uniref:Transglutaminase-like enzyme, putative cysteine protease n=1 Tax=Raineyella antarctica TaxID=1577474 RepID=A0A1G6GF27_9ACTN|nr:transglutaminase family protein [Raineyella antarctica]SDB80509.1 Transglutaminase-like enzyme, putative cysteine protease [Raineyella antarctica]
MRLSIDHVTSFRYATPVRASYNEARMTPVSTHRQVVWTSRLTISPTPWRTTYTDYWGTPVTCFEIHEPHDRLEIQALSLVETRPDGDEWDTERRISPTDLDWADLRGPAVLDSMGEYLDNSSRTTPHPELADLSAGLVDRAPRLAALDVCALVHDRLAYQAGSTAVTSTAAEAWAGGSGVCQDFSHVTCGALRGLGIPARYVSGYLHPAGPDAVRGTGVAAESHSWVEFWCGTWLAYDPTGMHRPDEAYVRIGHGRDYSDVPPLRGTYAGGDSEMDVKVTMTALS